MKLWWFLEPFLYTAFLILLIGAIAAWIIEKVTDDTSMAPVTIAMISMIPLIIWVLLAAIWLILWLFYTIWSPFI